MSDVTRPKINGKVYDHSSLEAIVPTLASGPIALGQALVEISYDLELEPGAQYGTSPKPGGRTRGQQKSSGSLTLTKEGARNFRLALADNPDGEGWMEVEFDLNLTYRDARMPTTTDELISCRATKSNTSSKSGNEATTEKWDLHIMDIKLDGIAATSK